jgi:nucleotide-binding universal stress UspA family protein
MRILFAVDESESAMQAAAVLRQFAPPNHLHVLHVVSIAPYLHASVPFPVATNYYDRLQENLVQNGQVLLKEVRAYFADAFKDSGTSMHLDTSLEIGSPVGKIIEAARKLDPDLLVLGSRGLGKLQEWVVDSVSYKVASQAHCPVLIVKRGVQKVRKVLLAYDGSADADRAVDFLEGKLFRNKVELTVATVLPLKSAAVRTSDVGGEQFVAFVKKAVADLAKTVCKRLSRRYVSSTQVLEGDPATLLAEVATERRMDLVVVGARGLTGIKRFFLGSVSHNLLHGAPCAVLIVKGKNMTESDKKSEYGEKKRSTAKRRACLICGKPAGESICEHCKITVRAEVISQKRRIEKGGAS